MKNGRLSTRVSRQVPQEYLALATRPQIQPAAIGREDALNDVERLDASCEALEDGPATDWLVPLCREVPAGRRQIRDANVAAAMRTYGECGLLMFNPADLRRCGSLIMLTGQGGGVWHSSTATTYDQPQYCRQPDCGGEKP